MSKLLFANIILLLCIIPFIYFLIKFVHPRLKPVYRWKTNLLISGTYLALLVLSLPLALFLDQGELFLSRNAQAQGLLAEAPDDWSEDGRRYHILENEPFATQSGLVENSRQTYPAETPQLEIRTAENSGYGRIFLERKKDADGMIEVRTYTAPHYARTDTFQSIDFTKLVPPPEIRWEEGILKIEEPVQQSFVFKFYGNSFIVRQLKRERQGYFGGGGSMSFGEGGIVVRVPADVEVMDGDSGEFTWVSSY
ncbi:hypothetical protein Desde_0292 [Desulfitobacterium dehalogenans ATCC 51507]|uniref:Uncharacterized protein n=1 Tax=Desulfitobacterium dehalogenans (strain ATCC 51507 / DSM 9161 / JW/IU-DC1) TaxID=756499 RepID=I4A478_DESDJ|nr:hypothetical protein [Desulfitobacterium dehalogenans]AFL98762.1 hypothetical protein Desde_0292 [Desulfitobacterium dehalogenans ATCC 51507]